ncbi:MAG: cation diffusion facilitator family transporter, partial [Deltaproteobacteria bacterium]|nr:cation diffusion facilitator family transporter [Deltaproteobacteria bacterium]
MDKRPQPPEPNRAEEEKRNAAMASIAAAVLLTTLKLGVGLATNSLGVLSEAAHSALDLMAAGMTYAAVRIAAFPPDPGHPYGHGKIENLSALVETVLLMATCAWITWEAVDRLFFNPAVVKASIWAVAVMGVSIIVDYSRSRMLMRVAKEHRSQALEADALHFSTDMLSSAVVLVGLGGLFLAEWLPETSTAR